jgi:hypothetical protein
VDCGATGDFISEKFIEENGLNSRSSILKPGLKVVLPDGKEYVSEKILRTAVLEVISGHHVFKDKRDLPILPIMIGCDIILGMPWLIDHNPDIDWRAATISPRAFCRAVTEIVDSEPLSEKDRVKLNESLMGVKKEIADLVNKYADVFREELPKGLPMNRPIEHHIELKPDAEPVYVRQWRVSLKDSEEIDRQVEANLLAEKIRPSTSPFNAPNVLVAKPDASKRMCQDYRGLNKITVKNHITMPRPEELFDRTKGAHFLSKLDLKQGFNQIRIAPEDISKTAFSCSKGHFEWLVMPFGMCNAPATFQSLMQMVLAEALNKFVIVFIDDILIFSSSEKEHLTHIEWVLQQLRKWKLYATPKKCEWAKKEIKFLGHVVSSAGVSVMKEKVKAIVEWPPLQNAKEVKAFLGLAGYYRKFVEGFSKIAVPLIELTKDKVEWKWDEQEKKAFQELKDAMSNTPTLVHPNMNLPFTLTTDASGYAVGAVLSQDHGQGQQPIAYMSKKMLPAERRYAVHEQELLAIVRALKEWRCYLHGSAHPIHVITDHMSLKYINSQPQLSNRQIRWVEYLQDFDFIVSYRAGSENHVADALSRRGDYRREAELDDEKDKLAPLPTLPRVKFTLAAMSISRLNEDYSELVTAIIDATKNDGSLEDIVEKPEDYGFSLSDEGILKNPQGCIVIPNDRVLRTRILREIHDAPTSGHLGIEKTMARLGKLFWWSGMRHEVQEYVGSCVACQTNKSSNRLPAGLLHPLPIPSHCWESVSMDFVGPLPPTSTGNDNIMVVVDRLSKMVHLIPCRITITAPQVANLFWREVVRHHGVPSSIISDRDPKFTSMFWKELWKLIGTSLNMSTAYHPQSDGQTERVNRVIEEILRSYLKEVGKDDWDQHLTAVEIAINTSKHASTELTPFQLNHGREMQLPLDHALKNVATSICPSAADSITNMSNNINLAKKNILKAQQRQSNYANQNRRISDDFKVGDRVMLSTENLNHKSGKFMSKFIGPFTILGVSADKIVELELPVPMKLRYQKFNISKVKMFRTSGLDFPGRIQQDRPAPELVEGENVYEVEEILAKRELRLNRGRGKTVIQYLVKWKGYPLSEVTWQKEEDLSNAREAITDFEVQQ